MNFSKNQKLYFNVLILFVFTFLLASKLISGFKTNDFNYIRTTINVVVIVLTVRNIIILNKD
jgi:hypothetical protein